MPLGTARAQAQRADSALNSRRKSMTMMEASSRKDAQAGSGLRSRGMHVRNNGKEHSYVDRNRFIDPADSDPDRGFAGLAL
jgi:hypothetical protein